MAGYNTSEFKKGLKVQIDGDPYLMIECNFVKPGKGQALYKCKLRNLLRGTVLDRTYKSGDSLDAADIATIEAQFLYKQGEQFVFMDNTSYEQYELTKEQVDDAWKWIKEGTVCSMLLYNGNPISMEAPNHMILQVAYAEPAMPTWSCRPSSSRTTSSRSTPGPAITWSGRRNKGFAATTRKKVPATN